MLGVELLLVLLAAFGLAVAIWLGLGRLVLPVPCPVRAVIVGRDGGDGLEQTVRGLLWLRRSGCWKGTVVIADGGLDPPGLALARTLAQRDGVELEVKTM